MKPHMHDFKSFLKFAKFDPKFNIFFGNSPVIDFFQNIIISFQNLHEKSHDNTN